MRSFYLALFLLFILLVGGCSKGESFPFEKIDTFISNWENGEFSSMYDMLSTETKESYDTEQFVERYEKIYNDLQIENLQIDVQELEKEALEKALEEGVASFDLSVSMDSIGGPIEFKEKLTMRAETDEEEEESEWFFDWTPALIFPELADGGKIRIETMPAKRGDILDRNQMPLAINDIAYEIGVVPNKFVHEAAEKEHVARLLQIDVDTIDEKLSQSWVQDDHFVPLKTIASTDEEKFNELLTIPSVSYVETEGRTYPSGKAAAHLTGYIGPVTAEDMEKHADKGYKDGDFIGKRGLEQLFESELRGEDGAKIFVEKENENGEIESVTLAEKEVKHGKHVQVTIDVNIQEKVFDAFDKEAGTATVINPKTGEILALVSAPSFDPTMFVYGISQTQWDALADDEAEPFLNRFSATFAPGSVIKPITAAVGLANGSIDPEEGLEIKGLTWSKNGWGDAKVTRVSTSDKPVDLQSALVRSDNIYFAMQAVEMGANKFNEGLENFGFNKQLPIDYPFKASQITNDGKVNDEILLAHSSYGQGELEVNTLHIALMYSAFINKGNIVKPALLADDPTSEVWIENIMSEEDAELVSSYLRDVVSDGTAKVANDEKFPISGKTGTAELKAAYDAKGHENGWFIGYPTESENMLVAMMVEKAENIGSSSYVAEKVYKLLKDINK